GLSQGTDPFDLFGIQVTGLTTGMAELIFFRAFQGIGAGMIAANAFAVIGDLLPPAERGRWQGLFGAVFGLASVIGPTIGGYITDNSGWQWVFYVNVPIGIVAITVVALTFPHLTPARRGGRSIDWLGALTLTAAVTPLLIVLSVAFGPNSGWSQTQTTAYFAVSAVMFGLFLLIEWRAKEPLLPLDLFKNRIFTFSMISVFIVGAGMFGALINLPLFIQGVQGAPRPQAVTPLQPLFSGLI